jgi:hypothetical protein
MIELREKLKVENEDLQMRLTFYLEMGAPWDIIQEIGDKHPQWKTVLCELQAQREMDSRSGMENGGPTVVLEAVADETVSPFKDSRSTFLLAS